jgi:hypothetical protein
MVDRNSYLALIGSLWSVAGHLRSVDLGEVRDCAAKYGTPEDIALIAKFEEITPQLPRRPGGRH